MKDRITPENIKRLEDNQVFVFGSNLSGRHGKGAAKTALGWGAKWGQAKGLQGKTYGIPTKDATIRKTLSVNENAYNLLQKILNYSKNINYSKIIDIYENYFVFFSLFII